MGSDATDVMRVHDGLVAETIPMPGLVQRRSDLAWALALADGNVVYSALAGAEDVFDGPTIERLAGELGDALADLSARPDEPFWVTVPRSPSIRPPPR